MTNELERASRVHREAFELYESIVQEEEETRRRLNEIGTRSMEARQALENARQMLMKASVQHG